MGWEKRKGTDRTYYVMKTRFGKEVVSHYVGKGETADLISQLQQIYRERDECRKWREALELERPAWESEIDAYCADVRAVFRASMQAAGWYQHKRQWRRGRGAKMAGRTKTPAKTKTPEEERAERFMSAQNGDQSAAALLFAEWQEKGVTGERLDFIYETFFGYADSRAGKNILLREAIGHKTESLRAELATAEDTPLERILIDRVIVCFHAVSDAERRSASMLHKESTLTSLEHFDKAVDRAQRRYLTAVRELGIARRLRLPKKEAEQQTTRPTGGSGGLRLLGGSKGAPVIVEERAA